MLWNIDGCIIGGLGIKSFICHKNGDFTYPIDSNCEPFMLVGTDELPDLNDRLKIYPNPAGNDLNFQSEKLSIEQISIYDITGQVKLKKICNSNECTLSISNLANGIYMAEVMIDNQRFTSKIIKN